MNKIQIKLMIRQRKTYTSRKWGLGGGGRGGGSVGEDFFFFFSFLFSSPNLCVLCFRTTELRRRAVGLGVGRDWGGGGVWDGGSGGGGGTKHENAKNILNKIMQT